MTLIAHELEKNCRKLVETSRREMADDTEASVIREMALALDHLDRSRKTNESLLSKITEMASAVDDRLLNIERLPHAYSPSQLMEKDNLRNQLRSVRLRIEADRRAIYLELDREVQRLRDRLLASWTRHELLRPNPGDRVYS